MTTGVKTNAASDPGRGNVMLLHERVDLFGGQVANQSGHLADRQGLPASFDLCGEVHRAAIVRNVFHRHKGKYSPRGVSLP